MTTKERSQAINGRAFFASLSIIILAYIVYQAGLSVNHLDLHHKLMNLGFIWIIILYALYASVILTMGFDALIIRKSSSGIFISTFSISIHTILQLGAWMLFDELILNSVFIFIGTLIISSIVIVLSSEKEECAELNAKDELFLDSIKLLIEIYREKVDQPQSDEFALLVKDGFISGLGSDLDLTPLGEVLIYEISDVIRLNSVLEFEFYPKKGKALKAIKIIKEFYNDNKK